nr:class I SAM-dependent RNA methyltransferase [Fulvivirga sedimenti]
MQGNLEDTMRLNLNLRTANRVLLLIDEFQAAGPDILYRELLRVPWEKIIPKDGYLSIHGYVKNDFIRDNRFAFMKMKDAIVDRMNEKNGVRPDSGPDMSGTVIYLHWVGPTVAVYLDTSGETIAKHGYRKIPGKAPMMESLAAAVVMSTGWDTRSAFINPMCGSGTIAIEAALMARNIAPGSFRSNFGFMHCNAYRQEVWDKVRSDVSGGEKTAPVIIASDHDQQAVRDAQMNARAAGVEEMITFEHCNFTETSIPEGEGIIILNPEYGERLGVTNALEKVYKDIGDFFKSRGKGKKGYVFTGNPDLAKKVGLRTSSRTPFLNARIECRLLEYELYAGSRKK